LSYCRIRPIFGQKGSRRSSNLQLPELKPLTQRLPPRDRHRWCDHLREWRSVVLFPSRPAFASRFPPRRCRRA